MKAVVIAVVAVLALASSVEAAGRGRYFARVNTSAGTSMQVHIPEEPTPLRMDHWTLLEPAKSRKDKDGVQDPFKTPLLRNAGPILLN